MPRASILPLLSPVLALLALLAFVLAIVDTESGLSFLPRGLAVLALLVSLAVACGILRYQRGRARAVGAILALAATLSFGCRLWRYEPLLDRTEAEWSVVQSESGEASARHLSARFRELAGRSRARARELARTSALARAVEGSDAQDYQTAAFAELDAAELPRAVPDAVPGATLYDAFRRPLAWTGENISLEGLFATQPGTPESEVVIVEHGVFTYLVAIEPLLSRLGFVTVEIPLAADRRLNNRHLRDFDALSSWAGRTVTTDYVRLGAKADDLDALFTARGEPHWSGTEEAPRLFFPLRSDDGQLLGASSFSAMAITTARLEARRSARLLSGLLLLVAALAVTSLEAGRLARSVEGGFLALARFLVVLWGLRVVVLTVGPPLGLGFDLDNPAHYASSLFFSLARSPIDLLLTMTVVFVSSALTLRQLWSNRAAGRERSASIAKGGGRRLWKALRRPLAAVAAAGLTIGAGHVLLDTWLNSNESVSTLLPAPFDAARLTIQVALLCLFASVAALGAVLTLVGEGDDEASFPRRVGRLWPIDLAVVAGIILLLPASAIAHYAAAALWPLLSVHLFACYLLRARDEGETRGVYRRLGVALAWLLLLVLSFYPALARFESLTIQSFIEGSVTPHVFQHGDAPYYLLGETLQTVDRIEDEGRLGKLDRSDLAYEIWASTDLAVSSLSSAVEILDGQRQIVSRFALNLRRSELPPIDEVPTATDDWASDEFAWEEGPEGPRLIQARRLLLGPQHEPWEIHISLAADWRNLPFISSQDPYIHLFRTANIDSPLPSHQPDLELFVFDRDGEVVFQSRDDPFLLEGDQLDLARNERFWEREELAEQPYNCFFFSDGAYIFALAYPLKPPLAYAAEVAGWALLTLCLAGLLLLAALALGVIGIRIGVEPRELWQDLGRTFYGKLYVAFVLLALVPIVSLAFLIRSIVVQQLERDVEQEGMARAQTVSRFVDDYLHYERGRPRETSPPTGSELLVDDELLEWVGTLVGTEVDLYNRGELTATSKRELFASGLLRTRSPVTAYRNVVLQRLTHSIHHESVGDFSYLVVSVPITLERWQEPGVLALPLASQKPEIDRKVASLSQTVLLAALGFSLAAAGLAHSLARRIAGPINRLTAATHRVAEGDFAVSLETSSRDEIGELFTAFTQMTSDLARQRQDLERTKKLEAWAEMARQVAHEVKNPLTPIQLSTEHMLRVFGDPDVDFEEVLKDCSDTILQQVKTLRQISMEFSTFASPEPLKLEPIELEKLVEETVAPYRQAPPDGVEVQLEMTTPVPELSADKRLLKRTLVNLVENALNALNGGGEVTVSLRPRQSNGERWVELSVADNGIGIEPELRERVFEPYFSTRAVGTGLGLAIARKVVEEHGGKISLQSEPGEGTRVTLELPVDRP